MCICIKTLKNAFVILISIAFLFSCASDNLQDIALPSDCDTTNVTYQHTVAPMMNTHCNDCHSGAGANGGWITDTYSGLTILVQNGKLWGAVNHEPGYLPMPEGLPKLSGCDLNRIKKWIDSGAPNN